MILPSTCNLPKSLLATAALALATLTGPVTAETVVILSEDWQTAGMMSGDISNATHAPLTGWAGFGLNNDNPTMLLVPSGGNVLRDQAGFGGTYGSADNAGNAARVRSSNGAMLNDDPLQLDTLAATSVTFSFYDLVSSTAPATPILIWPVYDPDGPGGNDPFAGIPPTGATTLLMAVPGDGPKRFFAMIERDGAAPSN